MTQHFPAAECGPWYSSGHGSFHNTVVLADLLISQRTGHGTAEHSDTEQWNIRVWNGGTFGHGTVKHTDKEKWNVPTWNGGTFGHGTVEHSDTEQRNIRTYGR